MRWQQIKWKQKTICSRRWYTPVILMLLFSLHVFVQKYKSWYCRQRNSLFFNYNTALFLLLLYLFSKKTFGKGGPFEIGICWNLQILWTATNLKNFEKIRKQTLISILFFWMILLENESELARKMLQRWIDSARNSTIILVHRHFLTCGIYRSGMKMFFFWTQIQHCSTTLKIYV